MYWSERGDAHPVCTGCGLVIGGALLVAFDYRDQGDGGNCAARLGISTNLDPFQWHRHELSAPYNRCVHFAEFLALATITGPAIPDCDMDAIAAAYAHTDRGRNWEDPLDLTCSRVRELLRGSMSQDDQRRYAERWLQIIQRLSGEHWFAAHGPPLMPSPIVQAMKERFYHFNRTYQEFHRENHPLFRGRNNVPYLCTVARGLLFQVLWQSEPEWAAQHRQWLVGDLVLEEFWEAQVLLCWRIETFWRLSWVFRWLKSPVSQLHNELMTAMVLERMRLRANHVLSWVKHPCLLPAKPGSAWIRELRRLLQSRSRSGRSGSRSRARSSPRSSGSSPAGSGAKPSTGRSCLQPTARTSGSTGTSSCSSRSPSYTGTLFEECNGLLSRAFPRSAIGSSECFSEASTASDLKRLLRQSLRSSGEGHWTKHSSIGVDSEEVGM